MKIIKRFFVLLLIYTFALIFPFSVRAVDFSNLNMAVKTGDRGIIGIIIAVVACIATAFITMRLTKHKNKKIK